MRKVRTVYPLPAGSLSSVKLVSDAALDSQMKANN